MKIFTRPSIVLVLFLSVIANGVAASTPGGKATNSTAASRDSLIHKLYDKHQAKKATDTNEGNEVSTRSLQEAGSDVRGAGRYVWKDEDHILVSVTSNLADANTTLRPDLEGLGFQTTACSTYTCDGYMNIENLADFENMVQVVAIFPSIMVLSSTQFGSGSVFNQATTALGVDALRSRFPSLKGDGIKIGVLSDSFDQLNPGEADRDVASGDLPPDVIVVEDGNILFDDDEGRAMMQLIHDIAPGAQLFFQTGVRGPAAFAAAKLRSRA